MAWVNPASPAVHGESLWPRVAELPLVVEACEYDRLHAVLAFEFERITTHVRLVGAGTEGLGEDVSAFREDGTTLHETQPSPPLAGEWTIDVFSEGTWFDRATGAEVQRPTHWMPLPASLKDA